jgi:hypothetical protein
MRWLWMAFCGLFLSVPAFGDTVSYNFDDGTLDGLIPAVANSSRYAYNVSGGVLNVSAAPVTGDGAVAFETPFSVSGDFTATLDATRSSVIGGQDMELFISTPFTGVYLYGPSNVFSSSVISPGFNLAGDSTSTVRLKISRTGNTVTTSFSDNGGGSYTTLLTLTDPSNLSTTPIWFEFAQDAGVTSAESGYFDNLSITSDSISTAPLPSAGWGGIALLAGLVLTNAVRHRFLKLSGARFRLDVGSSGVTLIRSQI